MKYLLNIIIIISSFSLISNSKSISQTYIDFTANDLEGNEIILSSLLKNGPVMIAFWRTWCPSCNEEQKAMNELYSKYKPSGFQYLGINVDNQKSVSKVRAYVSAHNFTFTVILDTDKKIFEMSGGTDDIMPYSLILSKTGDIIHTRIGFKSGDENEIENEIKKILNLN
ncbi:MAG: TlpA family protein disulfide reductase [Ignavibacteriae bacterium]|nr:MAG: TlpA family protein disulfide reductase [Ignavibacteriota bacterium]